MPPGNWQELQYRDLQQACKAFGISARGRETELDSAAVNGVAAPHASSAAAAAVVEEEDSEEKPAARTPLTIRRQRLREGAAETPSPAAATARRGQHALVTAAKTPLPRTPPGEQQPQSPGPAAAARPQPRRRFAAARRQRGSALLPSLGRLLTLAALAAALAALAVPAWKHYGCGTALRKRFPATAQQTDRLAATAHSVAAKLLDKAHAAVPEKVAARVGHFIGTSEALVEHHYTNAQRYCTYTFHIVRERVADLLHKGRAASSPLEEQDFQAPIVDPVCTGRMNTEALANVVPKGQHWDNLRQTAAAAWEGQKVDPTKATAMLFACKDAATCPWVQQWLAWAVVPDECRLLLEASTLTEGRGALQKALAGFLQAHPNGTVLISSLEQLAPELAPVLINALSEQGAFEQDGRAVPTSGATFLLTMQMPPEILAAMPPEILAAETEAAFKVQAKAQLVQTLAQHSSNPEETLAQAKALRRRIEYVLPTIA
ncbi:hypothetical protein N2152v2_000029 [Parachlorella kessleri]